MTRTEAQSGSQQAPSFANAFSVLGTITGAPPAPSITGVTESMQVTGPVPVTGTIDSPNLASWTLEYKLADASTWTQFAAGNTPAVSGTFDPTLMLNGTAQIRLTALDTSGQSTATVVNTVVSGSRKVGLFTLSYTDLSVPLDGPTGVKLSAGLGLPPKRPVQLLVSVASKVYGSPFGMVTLTPPNVTLTLVGITSGSVGGNTTGGAMTLMDMGNTTVLDPDQYILTQPGGMQLLASRQNVLESITERRTPPEDVGGTHGYEEYLTVLADPEHEEHEIMLQWRGPFDPETFSTVQVNQRDPAAITLP